MAPAEVDSQVAEVTSRHPRGSRKHVLDWTSRPTFCQELAELLAPAPVGLTPQALWMPRGHAEPLEARLETFGPRTMPESCAWERLRSWWLVHHEGANTPNWDLVMTAMVEGGPGLVLVEAKANVPELNSSGKGLAVDASAKSRANHARIGAAIDEARVAMSAMLPRIAISRDTHYQLSNRLAFMWRLASLGVPVVLVYLGFTGDAGITDAGPPFVDASHWRSVFSSHAQAVVSFGEAAETRLDCGLAPAWFLVRSRPVLQSSPPAIRRPSTSG